MNEIQSEMMNKISDIQELKLSLSNLRCDQGAGVNRDLEQVTIELKLDEVVRQHINKLKQAKQLAANPNSTSFEQALTQAISPSGSQRRERETKTRNLIKRKATRVTSFVSIQFFSSSSRIYFENIFSLIDFCYFNV